MAKTLITTPYPTMAEVARMLGVPYSRVRRVEAIMGLSDSEAPEPRAGKKKAAKSGGAKRLTPTRNGRKK